MLQAMLLSHLIGDYLLQTDALARWKSRSVWGVVVHGVLVTLATWLCSLPFVSGWWPYALIIGALHALIDLGRVKAGRVSPAIELFLFMGDQVAHGVVMVLMLRWSGWLAPRPAHTALGIWLQEGHRMALIMGYVLLSNPAWVLVHFLVKGMGAVSKSMPGRPGEKYLGMVERGLIATLVLAGQFLLVPLVVAPRLALDGAGSRVPEERIGYLEEMLISVGLALAVGLALRGLG
jgi:hypothetical protein